MASYYPHKQTVLITIACVIAVGGVFVYAKQGSSPKKSDSKPSVSTDIKVVSSEKISSTTDWRLSFIDKQTPSTPKPISTTQESKDLTLTDQFGRDFFARYIQLKQSNLIENESFVADTLNQSIYSAAQSAEQPKAYTLADVSILANATTAQIKAYGNSIGLIFSTHGVDGDPAVVANEAFEKGDMSLLKQIDPIISSYETITTMLKNLSVPQPLAAYHVDLLNAVSSMAKTSRDIRNVESDPMQTMVSVSAYTTVQNSLTVSLKSMKSYFSIVGISYVSTEPGSIFSQLL
ncbi:MAG: hypothetical protein RLY66_63 [Candidatus Parcubacteria bacterium]|jgi:hypothetical protein